MSVSLITYKRISTTLAKAKALRKYVEPIITTSKANTQHAHQQAFRYLQSKEAVKELFAVVAPKVGDRPGGYVRVVRTGTRLGDNAETALIELVDFNETYNAKEEKKTTRRRRRRGGKKSGADSSATAASADVETATVADEDTATEAVVAAGGNVTADVTEAEMTGEVIAEALVEEHEFTGVPDETVAEASPEAANEAPDQERGTDGEKSASA